MAHSQMLCVIIRTAGEEAAADARKTIMQPLVQKQLRGVFGSIKCLHFASLALLPPLPGVAHSTPSLMLELTIDNGVSGDALADTLAVQDDGVLAKVLGAASGTALTPTSLRATLKKSMDPAAGGFVGVRDRSRMRINAEQYRYRQARDLFRVRPASPASDERAPIVDALLRRLFGIELPAQWQPAPRSIWRKPWMHPVVRVFSIAATLVLGPFTAWRFGLTGWITAVMVSGVIAVLTALILAALFFLFTAPLITLPLLAVVALIGQFALSRLFEDAPVNQPVNCSRQTHASILACEAALVHRMQHMISVTEVRKPVWLFAPLLRYVLWVINGIGHIWCTEGRLGEAPGIHFGHWHVIDEGRRLIFASNFEVPFGGYLDDFIRGTPDGVNLIWRCTELPLRHPACPGEPGVEHARSFPPTRFGVLGGCRNEQWFKAYARDSMVPHLFRHEAYNLTYNDIDRATRLHEAMCTINALPERSPAAEDQVLRALES